MDDGITRMINALPVLSPLSLMGMFKSKSVSLGHPEVLCPVRYLEGASKISTSPWILVVTRSSLAIQYLFLVSVIIL